MRISDLGSYALGVCAAAMLAGCGGRSGTPLSPSPAGVTAERTHVRPTYSVLYSFGGGSGDGGQPLAGLINVKGTLYGTTSEGGGTGCQFGVGCGTVFSVTTSGTEAVLHSFKGKPHGDGSYPQAGLTDVNGTLYGTTFGGGEGKEGTVFSVTPSGTESVLYSFGGSGDGERPWAGLINVKGTLYGTTSEGGTYCSSFGGCGTVFTVTTSGTESVLHSFGGSGDGDYPLASLINVKGTLYGTTSEGSGTGCHGVGCGTVFTVTTSGKEAVLYRFKGGSNDGGTPEAGLLNVKGTLYGTTALGGANDDGTVFSVTTSGKETVLHHFGGSRDGSRPYEGLINIEGTLYGTTELGGANDDGTVFSITPSGTETVLYSFKGGSGDGAYPYAGLINVNGTLYGTTEEGGSSDVGTVFSLTL
jgi:uncharacterized repeat protein (TIGR03803 family)